MDNFIFINFLPSIYIKEELYMKYHQIKSLSFNRSVIRGVIEDKGYLSLHIKVEHSNFTFEKHLKSHRDRLIHDIEVFIQEFKENLSREYKKIKAS